MRDNFPVEFVGDCIWRAGRRMHRIPRIGLVSRHARLGEGRNFGIIAQACGASYRQRPDAARLHHGYIDPVVEIPDIRFTNGDAELRGTAAFVGNVHQIYPAIRLKISSSCAWASRRRLTHR